MPGANRTNYIQWDMGKEQRNNGNNHTLPINFPK